MLNRIILSAIIVIVLVLICALCGCATDSITKVYRNKEGKITKIEQKQRCARYIPAIGKSKAKVGEASVKLDSSIFPKIDFKKED